MKAKAFDSQLFRRILKFTRPYQLLFRGVALIAVLLSLVTALRPYLLKQTGDAYIQPKDAEGLLHDVCLMGLVLLMEGVGTKYYTRHTYTIISAFTSFSDAVFRYCTRRSTGNTSRFGY